MLLAQCQTLLANVGASCHSDHEDQLSLVVLSCGIPVVMAQNAIHISVGHSTSTVEVDIIMQDIKQAMAKLDGLVKA